MRLIGVDTLETVDPEGLVGCYGPEASEHTKEALYERETGAEGKVLREGRLTKLEIPCIGDSDDAYRRTLAYVWLDVDGDGSCEHLYNEDLVQLGLARTTDFSHGHHREFERELEEARKEGSGLRGSCPEVEGYGRPRLNEGSTSITTDATSRRTSLGCCRFLPLDVGAASVGARPAEETIPSSRSGVERGHRQHSLPRIVRAGGGALSQMRQVLEYPTMGTCSRAEVEGGHVVTLAEYGLKLVAVVVMGILLLHVALLLAFTRMGLFVLFVGAFVSLTAALSGAALLAMRFLYPQTVAVAGFSGLLWLVIPASLASVLLFDFLLDGLLLRVLKPKGVSLSAIWAAEAILRGPFVALSLVAVSRLLEAVELAVGAAIAAGFAVAFIRYYLGLWMGEGGLGNGGDAAADLSEVLDAEETI